MKILSQESNIGTASSVSSATAVRIYNSDSSAGIVTRTDSDDNTIGKLTVPAGEVLYLEKKSNDKLIAPSTVLASKVAYSHMMYYASYSSGGGGYSDGEIVTSNLTYHLDANNSSSYGGSGNTWTDLVAGTNNATINGPSYTLGSENQGYYFDFDGTDDYVEFDQNAFDLGTRFTIEIWWRHDSASESTQAVPYLGNSSNHQGVVFSTNKSWVGNSATSPLLTFGKENVLYTSSGSTPTGRTIGLTDLPLQTWRQVVLTKASGTSGANLNLYLNGSLVATPTSSSVTADDYITNDSNTSILGANALNALNAWWDGQVSIFRVYSEPLSATQVETNYDANKGRYGLS